MTSLLRRWHVAFYRDVIFPRLMNLAMDTKSSREIRARVCADLR